MLVKDLESGKVHSLNLLDPDIRFLFYHAVKGCIGLYIPNNAFGKNPVDVNTLLFLKSETLEDISVLMDFKRRMLGSRSLLLFGLRGQSSSGDEENFPFYRAVFSADDDLESVSAQDIFYRTLFCGLLLEDAKEGKVPVNKIKIFQGRFKLSWNDGKSDLSFGRLKPAIKYAMTL